MDKDSEIQLQLASTDDTKTVGSNGLSLPLITIGALALFALVVGFAVWWEARDTRHDLTQTLGAKLADVEKQSREVGQRNDAMNRDLRDTQNRVAQLEAKLADLQNQRVAIEDMTRELARAPEDWLLSEIEQTLNIASRELTLAGNVRAAIAALQTVDQRLSRADKLQATPLRRAVTLDLERLKATPAVDTQGVIVTLDTLMTQVAALPLAVPASMVSDTPAVAANTDSWAVRAWRDFIHDMKDLVRIRALDPAEAGLITPQQGAFVRESLKLRLLSARTSLLARDEQNFRDDIKAAHTLVTRYFDPKARANQNALSTLKSVGENRVAVSVPDIQSSLIAIRSARELRNSSSNAGRRP